MEKSFVFELCVGEHTKCTHLEKLKNKNQKKRKE